MDDKPLSPIRDDQSLYSCDECGNQFFGHQAGMELDFDHKIQTGRELIVAVEYDDIDAEIQKIEDADELEYISASCRVFAFTCPKCGTPHPHGFQQVKQ